MDTWNSILSIISSVVQIGAAIICTGAAIICTYKVSVFVKNSTNIHQKAGSNSNLAAGDIKINSPNKRNSKNK